MKQNQHQFGRGKKKKRPKPQERTTTRRSIELQYLPTSTTQQSVDYKSNAHRGFYAAFAHQKNELRAMESEIEKLSEKLRHPGGIESKCEDPCEHWKKLMYQHCNVGPDFDENESNVTSNSRLGSKFIEWLIKKCLFYCDGNRPSRILNIIMLWFQKYFF